MAIGQTVYCKKTLEKKKKTGNVLIAKLSSIIHFFSKRPFSIFQFSRLKLILEMNVINCTYTKKLFHITIMYTGERLVLMVFVFHIITTIFYPLAFQLFKLFRLGTANYRPHQLRKI